MEVLLLLVKPASIVALFLVTGWMFKSWLGHRERMRRLALTEDGQTGSDQRLARLEQAVESIAIEVERISEGQRFVTKLLAEPEASRNGVAAAHESNLPS